MIYALTRKYVYLVILVPIIIATFGICPSFGAMPVPDCGIATNVEVTGTVSDLNQNSIPGAEIVIRSEQRTGCPNTQPIDDLLLTTDQNGKFSGIISYVAEDDILEMTVSADGYVSEHFNSITYVRFDEPLEIILIERNQSDR